MFLRFASLLLLAFACAPSSYAGQERRESAVERSQDVNSAASEARSVVRGKAIYQDSGKPVRRAAVLLLTDLNYPPSRRAIANESGEFVFRDVAAGDYFVVADAPGGVAPTSGLQLSDFGLRAARPAGNLTRVTVDGTNEAKTTVGVRRGGAITGRIAYSDGEPATNARILLYSRRDSTTTPYFAEHAVTDDRGVYRVEGLPASEYVVGVAERGAGGGKIYPRDTPGTPSRFYPEATSLSRADAVRVEAGAETAGVDITLAADMLRKISGDVRWRRDGRAVSGATVSIRRKDEPPPDISVASLLESVTPPGTNKDDTMMRDMGLLMLVAGTTPYVEADERGRWTFQDLPPGDYVINVSAPLPRSSPNSDGRETDASSDEVEESLDRPLVHRQRKVTIAELDVEEIRIELTRGARITGTVVTEDGAPVPHRILLSLHAPNVNPVLNAPAYTEPDGSFSIEGVSAGEARLDATLPATSDYYVQSIVLGDTDLRRSPLRVTEEAEITPVRVTLGRGRAQLSGCLTTSAENGSAAGAGILLVPLDAALWQTRSARFFSRADAGGRFALSAAPGEHLGLTWLSGEEPTGSLEGFIRSRAATARRIVLQQDRATVLNVDVAPLVRADN